jgi:hypothetical protein
MVVGESENGSYHCLNATSLDYTFVDQRAAEGIAERYTENYKNVFVVEAVSRYSVPEPRVVKQNLHIPPLTPRGESNE